MHRDYLEILLRTVFGDGNMSDSTISLSIENLARYAGLQALLSVEKQSTGGVPYLTFLEMWKKLLPHQFESNYEVSFAILGGLGILTTPTTPTTTATESGREGGVVRYLNRRDLYALDEESRIRRMFTSKKVWRVEEASVYLDDLGDDVRAVLERHGVSIGGGGDRCELGSGC